MIKLAPQSGGKTINLKFYSYIQHAYRSDLKVGLVLPQESYILQQVCQSHVVWPEEFCEHLPSLVVHVETVFVLSGFDPSVLILVGQPHFSLRGKGYPKELPD